MNRELVERTIAYIEAHPEEHSQDEWAIRKHCGTTMCLAGHLVTQAGAKIRWSEHDPSSTQCITPEGNVREIEDYAGEVADFSPEQANTLFWMTDTLDDIKRILNYDKELV